MSFLQVINSEALVIDSVIDIVRFPCMHRVLVFSEIGICTTLRKIFTRTITFSQLDYPSTSIVRSLNIFERASPSIRYIDKLFSLWNWLWHPCKRRVGNVERCSLLLLYARRLAIIYFDTLNVPRYSPKRLTLKYHFYIWNSLREHRTIRYVRGVWSEKKKKKTSPQYIVLAIFATLDQ